MNGNNKRKAKAAKAAALIMTLMLTAFTLLMSGCGEAEVSERTEDSTATAKTVVWDYVSPSDLQGDTAKADTDTKTNADADTNAKADGQAPPEGEAPPSGEAPSGQPPEMPNGQAPDGEAPSGAPGGGRGRSPAPGLQ